MKKYVHAFLQSSVYLIFHFVNPSTSVILLRDCLQVQESKEINREKFSMKFQLQIRNYYNDSCSRFLIPILI